MKKVRIVIQMEEGQLAAVKKQRERTGASVAEIVRRSVAMYLSAQQRVVGRLNLRTEMRSVESAPETEAKS